MTNQDPREVTIPIDGRRILANPHTAALADLAAAIRELADALRASFTPPSTPGENGDPKPANGLVTQIRPNPDYRPRGAARRIVGFTQDTTGGE